MEAVMTPRKQKNLRQLPPPAEPLRIQHPHAAGIDVHSREHWVAVPAGSAPRPPRDQPANLPAQVRRFGTCTADLEMLADFLKECGVNTVAMESTGVYWVPLFELLERRGFEVFLVDPRQTRQVAGRPKTDVRDCQWIQKLHSYGLLSASFRPEDQVVVLRGFLRQRHMLIRYGSRHIQHMQKALEQMNVKLTEVVSDITGLTGMSIIKAILAGERDPLVLAKLRDDHCRHSEAEIARALYGNWRVEHLFALRQAVEMYEAYRRQVHDCDLQVAAHLGSFADKSGDQSLPAKKKRRRRRGSNEPTFDARWSLFRMCGVDLTVIEGIDENTALVILGEIGVDMSKWPTVKHFISWLGLCPQRHSSAGKIKGRQSRGRLNTNRAALALRLAAQGCHRANNAMGAFYRRVQARAGGNTAVTATARKIGERVYRLLKFGADYVRQGVDAYEEVYRLRVVKSLARKAEELGYQLIPVVADPSTSADPSTTASPSACP
jgi:transposase